MQNSIKKIIIKGIGPDDYLLIAVRENGIQKYESLTEEEITNLCESLQEEIIAMPDYDGLTEEEIEEKLISSGIVSTLGPDDDFIEQIICYSKENKYKAIFNSGNVVEGEIEPTDELSVSDYDDLIDQIWNFYEIEASDLEAYGLLVYKQKNKLSELFQKHKVRNLKIGKSLLALVTVGAVFAAGYGVNELKNNKANQKTDKSKETAEDTIDSNLVNNNFKEEIKEVSEITPSPDLAFQSQQKEQDEISSTAKTPTATTSEEISLPSFEDEVSLPIASENVEQQNSEDLVTIQSDIYFPNREYDQTSYELVVEINKDYLLSHNYGDETYDYNIDNLIQVNFDNMSEIGNYLQDPYNNPELNGTGTVIYFEKLFSDREDKAFISYFNKFRNEIIWSMYDSKDLDSAHYYINNANKEIVRCIRDDYPIVAEIAGEPIYVCYSDLTNEAKNVVLNIAYGINATLAHDEFEYEGELYWQDSVGDIVLNAYNNLENSKTK